MDKSCGNWSVDLLQATEPKLFATLLKIDRAKKALRGHSSANDKVLPGSSGFLNSFFDSRGCTSTVYSCWKFPIPKRTTSDPATRTVNPWELPRLHCQNSAEPHKAQNPSQSLGNPTPKSNLTTAQEEIFYKRRTALYRPAPPLESKLLVVGHYTPKIRHRRNHFVEVFKPIYSLSHR